GGRVGGVAVADHAPADDLSSRPSHVRAIAAQVHGDMTGGDLLADLGLGPCAVVKLSDHGCLVPFIVAYAVLPAHATQPTRTMSRWPEKGWDRPTGSADDTFANYQDNLT